jgi:hypothetical protein
MSDVIVFAPRQAILRAPAATFAVYLWTTALAALVAVPMSASGRVERLFSEEGFAWLEATRGLDEVARIFAATLGAATLLAWIGAPLVQGMWLSSLAHRTSLADSFARSLRLYPRMLLVTLLLAPPLAIAAVVALGPPVVIGMALSDTADARLADMAALLSTLPGLFLFFFWRGWHDGARAAIAMGESPLRAARSGFAALGPRLFAIYLGWAALSGLLALAAHALGPLGTGGASSTAVFAATQVLAFTRVMCRERWLDAVLRSIRAPAR